MEDKAYLLDYERAKEKDDMPGIENLVCSDNENKRPNLTDSESSSGKEEMHLMNNMHETTNSVDSDKENDIPDLTNSEPSSGEEEMPEVIDYSTMPELIKDYSNVHQFYDSGEDSSEAGSELEKDDGIYLITSVANLRRREDQCLETSFNERKLQLKKRQKKKETKGIQSKECKFS